MGQAVPLDAGRWRQLAIIGVAELLALAPWLGSSAAAPSLVDAWALYDNSGPSPVLLDEEER